MVIYLTLFDSWTTYHYVITIYILDNYAIYSYAFTANGSDFDGRNCWENFMTRILATWLDQCMQNSDSDSQ